MESPPAPESLVASAVAAVTAPASVVTVTTTITAAPHTLVERQVDYTYSIYSAVNNNGYSLSYISRQLSSVNDNLYSQYSQASVANGYLSSMSVYASRADVRAGGTSDTKGSAMVVELAVLIVVVALAAVALLITLIVIAYRLGKSNRGGAAASPLVARHSPKATSNSGNSNGIKSLTKEYGTTTAH
ncbi:uncharacterized protein EHS24_009569 [Apiotrichum porosum]|uniref:Uncharacterized protein n=1 Tax=Apiotrichum porosum TaxID=105984 RepID=A0A427XLX4_9TREE|nr:uncharacterized protein EHS24_009569 [Apiotrichum porosum]RSH79901.1 hypothetical protein EHS24_009569 [Apiotrichum porosum]